MLANGCALVLAIAVTACGRGGSWDCISRGHGGAYDECASGGSHQESPAVAAARERDNKAKAEQLARDREAKRRAYEAAKPPCAQRDANACWTVAVYAMANNHPQTETIAALEVACDGKLADGCFELGRLKNDVALLATACELGHLRACQVAVVKDPSRAMTFDRRACELHDGAACERMAAASTDRAEIEQYLKRACGEQRKDACRRLGELSVGAP
jgi:hypothetical protein